MIKVEDAEADEIERNNNRFTIDCLACPAHTKWFKTEMSEYKFMKYFEPYKNSAEYSTIYKILAKI